MTGATLVRADGTRIRATLANGWLVAWWPGNNNVTSAEVATATRTTSESINNPAAMPCPAGAVCGGASGSSSGGASGGVPSGPTSFSIGRGRTPSRQLG